MKRVGALVAAVIGLGLGAGSGPADAEALFGVAFEPGVVVQGIGGPSTLYSIDATTGVSTAIGPGIGFDKVGAIDFEPITGTLFGVGDQPGTPFTPTLITIDTTTGLGAPVGPLTGTTTTNNAYTDLSFDAGGTLHLFQVVPQQLFTVDTTSAAATALPPPGLTGIGNAIAFDPGGTLFWGQFLNASTLNPITGVGTQGPAFTFPPDCNRLAAADFPASGAAFAVLKCSNAGLDDRLARVDFAGATVTEVAPFTDSATGMQIVGMDAIAHISPN